MRRASTVIGIGSRAGAGGFEAALEPHVAAADLHRVDDAADHRVDRLLARHLGQARRRSLCDQHQLAFTGADRIGRDDEIARGLELLIDFTARTVSNGSATAHLTPKELDLLRYLTAHANEVVPHRKLLQAVWGPDYGDETEYLRVFVRNLRKKLEIDPEHPEYILTEPWVGYRFKGIPDMPESGG